MITENNTKKGIIVAGFGAIGKTMLGELYNNVIDLESGYYSWDNSRFENVPYEKRKGKKNRRPNNDWPNNYYAAILEAKKEYDVVLTSMHWHLLEYFEKNNIEYYLAYPTIDSEEVLEKRCYDRGNNNVFTDKLKINLKEWNLKINNYRPKKILYIEKHEYLEAVLIKEKII